MAISPVRTKASQVHCAETAMTTPSTVYIPPPTIPPAASAQTDNGFSFEELLLILIQVLKME